MKGQKLFLPVTSFSKVPPSEFATYDDRYIPAEIVVMHSGDNLNQSHFSEESIAQASWSLSDIPILGFIRKTDDGGYDFDGHNVKVVLENDQHKIKQMGRIIGNIPKNNNYHYTYYPNKDEIYVAVEGFLWADYMNEALEIFQSNREKSVSMEIIIDDGLLDDRGIFNITKYRYTGICILGEGVEPAMSGAKITIGNTPLESYSKNYNEKEVLNLDLENIKIEETEEIIEPVVEIEEDEIEPEKVEPVAEEEIEKSAEETPFEDEPDTKPTETVRVEIPTLTDEEKEELKALREFKAEILERERNEKVESLFSKCEENNIDVSEIRNNSEGKSFEELEQEVALYMFKNNFSVKKQSLPDDDSKKIVNDVSNPTVGTYGKYSDRLKNKGGI